MQAQGTARRKNALRLQSEERRNIMEKLKPKLFSVMKTYTKEQFVKDVVAGIIVEIGRAHV